MTIRRRGITCAGAGLALLALALVSCGGTRAANHAQHLEPVGERSPPAPSATDRPLARIPPASAVPMIPTPRAALVRCRESRLLRRICPRRVPLSLHPASYDLAGGCANAAHITIASSRCTLPVWSYEVFAPLPGQTAARSALPHVIATLRRSPARR